MPVNTPNDAFFANRVFVLGEQNGFKFLLWGTHSIPSRDKGGMMFSSSIAEPAEGAFLCQIKSGWIFVAGGGKNNSFRHTFFDDTDQAFENAASMQALGIPVLTVEEGNKRIKEEGVPLYSITGDEARRAAAVATNARANPKTEHNG